VVFTLAFDDQGRLDRLDGGRLASKFEWTELPKSGCLPVSVSSTTASPWSPPSRGDGE
jgi:hypothetical protein